VPTRNADLLRWCLSNDLRIVQNLPLMTAGIYQGPKGAYLPSILVQVVALESLLHCAGAPKNFEDLFFVIKPLQGVAPKIRVLELGIGSFLGDLPQ